MESAIFWGLMGLVALMPLPLGSARPWASSFAAVAVGVLLMVYGLWLSAAKDATARVPLSKLLTPALIGAPALVWAIVQTLPIGPGPLADPIWANAGEALRKTLPGRISSDVFGSITAVMRVVTYFGVFALAVLLCRSARLVRRALIAVTSIGAAYALFGLFALFFTPDKLLWFDRWAYLGDLTSTFVNRNSYATFAGLGLLCSFTLLVLYLEEAASTSGTAKGLAANLLRLAATRGSLPILAVFALLSAILLSHSRGGFLSTGIGTTMLLLFLVTTRRIGRLSKWIIAGLAIVGATVMIDLSGGVTLGRLARTILENDARPEVYRLVLEGIAERPLLGHGYGTFELAFHAYGDGSLKANWDKAHNDYLETAFELGIPAAAALTSAIGYVGISCALGAWRRRRDSIYPALGAAATALIAAHALVDFSLQIPAVTALYATILGLGYAQSWSTARPGRE